VCARVPSLEVGRRRTRREWAWVRGGRLGEEGRRSLWSVSSPGCYFEENELASSVVLVTRFQAANPVFLQNRPR